MLGIFKKSLRIPYDKNLEYPSKSVVREYVSRYCDEAGWEHYFTSDSEVMINGEKYEAIVWYPSAYHIKLVKVG